MTFSLGLAIGLEAQTILIKTSDVNRSFPGTHGGKTGFFAELKSENIAMGCTGAISGPQKQ